MLHCRLCSNTNLHIIQTKIFKDPIFIIMHTMLALGLVHLSSVSDQKYQILFGMVGMMVYIFVLALFMAHWRKATRYFCRDCATLTLTETDVRVAEYEIVPKKRNTVPRKPVVQKYCRLKEIGMMVGAVSSVAALILYVY